MVQKVTKNKNLRFLGMVDFLVGQEIAKQHLKHDLTGIENSNDDYFSWIDLLLLYVRLQLNVF